MLAGEDLRRRRVVELLDADVEAVHVQPNGVDLSLQAVWRLVGAGSLGCADDDRVLPARQDLAFGSDGWLELGPGTYGVRYAEWIAVPIECGGLCFPRSSLLRMGVHVPTAVWDAGYAGRGEGLLVVTNPHGVRLQQGARIVQLILFELTEPARSAYAGRYQHEGGATTPPG
jgi:dUTP pyrophosphatase